MTLSLGMVNSCVLLLDNDPLPGIGQVQILLSSRPSPMEWSLISFFTPRPSPIEWSLISFFTSRPSPMEWSLIFLCLHQGPLRWNGHWFSYVYSKTLSDGMVIVFFPYIKALSDGMVIDFLMFTSRPSLMEWSLIFLCLQ